MSILRLIGDVHGKWGGYCEIVNKANKQGINTLQVGDFGFKPHYKCLQFVCPLQNKILLGNHDDYVDYKNYLHFLGDFGLYNPYGNNEVFYIRGERSIDKRQRIEYVNWFSQEELNFKQGLECIKTYTELKPKIVISHGCPSSIIDNFSNMTYFDGERLYPSTTSQLLECLLDVHRPFLWVFGHYHVDKCIRHKGVKFVCVNELSTYDIEV